jgi:hypothetical protein
MKLIKFYFWLNIVISILATVGFVFVMVAVNQYVYFTLCLAGGLITLWQGYREWKADRIFTIAFKKDLKERLLTVKF